MCTVGCIFTRVSTSSDFRSSDSFVVLARVSSGIREADFC